MQWGEERVGAENPDVYVEGGGVGGGTAAMGGCKARTDTPGRTEVGFEVL